MPSHQGFYFEGSGLPLSFCRALSGSMCNVHIALQELQAGVLMLCIMVFLLFSKVVALHLDKSTATDYLCNQVGTVSSFLLRIAHCILHMTDNCTTLIPAYIPGHLNMEGDYLPWAEIESGMASSSLHSLIGISTLVSTVDGFAGIITYQSMSTLLHHGESITSGSFGVELFQPSLKVSGELCFSPALFPLVCPGFWQMSQVDSDF